MISREDIRILRFGDAKRGTGGVLVVVLEHVTRTVSGMLDFQENRILLGELLLEPRGNVEADQVIVRTIAGFGAVILIEGKTAVAKIAVFGGVLQPGAAGGILGVVIHAHMITFKEPRVLLLGNILGKRDRTDWREEVSDEQLAEPGRFVAQIGRPGIAQGIVAVGKEEMRAIIGVTIIHPACR